MSDLARMSRFSIRIRAQIFDVFLLIWFESLSFDLSILRDYTARMSVMQDLTNDLQRLYARHQPSLLDI